MERPVVWSAVYEEENWPDGSDPYNLQGALPRRALLTYHGVHAALDAWGTVVQADILRYPELRRVGAADGVSWRGVLTERAYDNSGGTLVSTTDAAQRSTRYADPTLLGAVSAPGFTSPATLAMAFRRPDGLQPPVEYMELPDRAIAYWLEPYEGWVPTGRPDGPCDLFHVVRREPGSGILPLSSGHRIACMLPDRTLPRWQYYGTEEEGVLRRLVSAAPDVTLSELRPAAAPQPPEAASWRPFAPAPGLPPVLLPPTSAPFDLSAQLEVDLAAAFLVPTFALQHAATSDAYLYWYTRGATSHGILQPSLPGGLAVFDADGLLVVQGNTSGGPQDYGVAFQHRRGNGEAPPVAYAIPNPTLPLPEEPRWPPKLVPAGIMQERLGAILPQDPAAFLLVPAVRHDGPTYVWHLWVGCTGDRDEVAYAQVDARRGFAIESGTGHSRGGACAPGPPW